MKFIRAVGYLSAIEIVAGVSLLLIYYFTRSGWAGVSGFTLFIFGGVLGLILFPAVIVVWSKNRSTAGSGKLTLKVLALIVSAYITGGLCYFAGVRMVGLRPTCEVTLINESSRTLEDVKILINPERVNRDEKIVGTIEAGKTGYVEFSADTESHANLRFRAGELQKEALVIGYFEPSACGKYEVTIKEDLSFDARGIAF